MSRSNYTFHFDLLRTGFNRLGERDIQHAVAIRGFDVVAIDRHVERNHAVKDTVFFLNPIKRPALFFLLRLPFAADEPGVPSRTSTVTVLGINARQVERDLVTFVGLGDVHRRKKRFAVRTSNVRRKHFVPRLCISRSKRGATAGNKPLHGVNVVDMTSLLLDCRILSKHYATMQVAAHRCR